MTTIAVGGLTVMIWAVLMVAIWWPFTIWLTRGLAEAHAHGVNVDSSDLFAIIPVMLLVVAYEVARRVWRRRGDWNRSGAELR